MQQASLHFVLSAPLILDLTTIFLEKIDNL